MNIRIGLNAFGFEYGHITIKLDIDDLLDDAEAAMKPNKLIKRFSRVWTKGMLG